jgi:hypothetical protein
VAEYYKREIAKWIVATDDLTLEQEAAYSRVVDMIRLYERPFRHNLRVLGGMWRCNERKAKRLLDELVAAGKLSVEDGFIIDEKAVNDASTLRGLRVDRASAGRRGGIESGKSRRKALEDNETDEASASTREEKRREEKEGGGGGDARETENPDPPIDPPPTSTALPDDAYRLYDAVLLAVGLDPAKPLPTYWMPPTAVIEVVRLRGLGIDDDEIVAVAKGTRTRNAVAPDGPKALLRAMNLYAAAKQAPKLTPPPPPEASRMLSAPARASPPPVQFDLSKFEAEGPS